MNADELRQRILDAMLRSLLKEYPLRIFLLATTGMTPPAAFGGAHG